MKHFWLSFVFTLCCVPASRGQRIEVLPNPHSGPNGFSTGLIKFRNHLYFSYIDSASYLAKSDGNSVWLLPQAAPVTNRGYYFDPIIYNNFLYYRYEVLGRSNYSQLAKCNGDSITLIPNLDPAHGGFTSSGISNATVHNNFLYFQYALGDRFMSKYCLAKYNGTTLSLCNNLDTNDMGVLGLFVPYRNQLYFAYRKANGGNQLAKYDGISITLIPNPDNNYGIAGYPIVFNDELYFCYHGTGNAIQLAKYDGMRITLIPNPNGITNVGVDPIIFNNQLYFRCLTTANNWGLAKYDGSTIQIIYTHPSYYGFAGKGTIYKNHLYYPFLNNLDNRPLAKCDGTNVTIIQTPEPSDIGFDSNGDAIIYNDKLYYQYRNRVGYYQMAQYDGTILRLISNLSTADVGYWTGNVIHNNNLFFGYATQNSTAHLAKFYENTAVAELNSSNRSFYPNPVGDYLTVKPMGWNARMEIYDMQGRICAWAQANESTLNVQHLTAGLYTIKVTDEMGTTIHKFVKQ